MGKAADPKAAAAAPAAPAAAASNKTPDAKTLAKDLVTLEKKAKDADILYNKSKKAALALEGKIKQLQDWINNGVKTIQAKADANLKKGDALKTEIKQFFSPTAPPPAAAATAPAAKLRRMVMSVSKGISELESFFENGKKRKLSSRRKLHPGLFHKKKR